MNELFEQSKALFNEQFAWYTAQVNKATEAFMADAEQATKSTRETWGAVTERQLGLINEFTKQTQDFVNKQVKLVEQVFAPAA